MECFFAGLHRANAAGALVYRIPARCAVRLLHRKIGTASQRCQPAFQSTGVQLLGIHSRVVFPDEWNTLLDDYGGKAEVLSRATLLLVRDILQRFEGQRARVHCDKHGGRNHYAALLQDVMGDEWIEVRRESRELSVYRYGSAKRRREFYFAMEGENHLAGAGFDDIEILARIGDESLQCFLV